MGQSRDSTLFRDKDNPGFQSVPSKLASLGASEKPRGKQGSDPVQDLQQLL